MSTLTVRDHAASVAPAPPSPDVQRRHARLDTRLISRVDPERIFSGRPAVVFLVGPGEKVPLSLSQQVERVAGAGSWLAIECDGESLDAVRIDQVVASGYRAAGEKPVIVAGRGACGTAALGLAILHSRAVWGAANLGGRLPASLRASLASARLLGLHVYWAHGMQSRRLRWSDVERDRWELSRAGATVVNRDYPCRASLGPAALREAGHWLAQQVVLSRLAHTGEAETDSDLRTIPAAILSAFGRSDRAATPASLN